jgi:exonuclease SbcD
LIRLIHTSDWHLGQTLRDMPRDEEQVEFLAWLLDVFEEEQAEGLLVCGDIFDTSNPSAAAQRHFFSFLAQFRARFPEANLILVGGNHDSGHRLDAMADLLAALRIHVIGTFPSGQPEKMILPLYNRAGEIAAWVAAVPYVREAELEVAEDEVDPLTDRIRKLYRLMGAYLRARRKPGQSLLATGHCYVRGGRLSPGSERRIQVGNQFPLPPDVFPPELAYIALGHLHFPQEAGDSRVVYSGAPMPFAMDEGRYPHQIQIVDLEGDSFKRRGIRVPRWTEFLSWPEEDRVAGLKETEAWIKALEPLPVDFPSWRRPFLELRVDGEGLNAGLWDHLQRLLRDRLPRLIKLTDLRPVGAQLKSPGRQLSELSPVEVFKKRWMARYPEKEIPQDVLNAFFELLAEAEGG